LVDVESVDEHRAWLNYEQSFAPEKVIDEDFSEGAPEFERRMRVVWAGFERVGQGLVTNGVETGKCACGGYFGLDFCNHPELHNKTAFDDAGNVVNYAGKTFWHKRFRWCHRPSCPVCYKYGWSSQAAERIERRIKLLEAKYGMKAEHLFWSPPQSDYGLTSKRLVAKMMGDFKALKVVGGVRIFHMERFAKSWEARRKRVPEGWRISLHFHIIGFIDGGYGRCRLCKKPRSECLKCDGFDGRARRLNLGFVDDKGKSHEGNGDIIKVAEDKFGNVGERSSIKATAWYQLNHASLRVGVSRQNVAVWFGVGGKRMKVLKNSERFVRKCPICLNDLVHGHFVGEGAVDGGHWEDKSGMCNFLDSRGVPQFVETERG
jgi:hypothetical protein